MLETSVRHYVNNWHIDCVDVIRPNQQRDIIRTKSCRCPTEYVHKLMQVSSSFVSHYFISLKL